MSTATGSLSAVRVQGALLPPDVIAAVLAGTVDGLDPGSFHLGSEAPREAAARVWHHLLPAYRRFRTDLDRLGDGDPAVGLTRERWLGLLLAELGYGRVPLNPAGGLVVREKSYPLSHRWEATPVHQLGWNVDLDTRTPGVAGAAQRAPHAMVQELLNRTDDYLWAIVSNGRVLRLLRDSTSLSGQAFVEIDLEAIFDGELYSEFVVLYLLAHQSRVEVPAEGVPTDCWLERWRVGAVRQGVRALGLLREGVQLALEVLGTGFLQHPANHELRDRLASGDVSLDALHQSLLRLAYRFLFWSVAEDRSALHAPGVKTEERERYAQHFSSQRLRENALRSHGTRHHDLWRGVTVVMRALAGPGEPRLGLPGLGGLFRNTGADLLDGCEIPNEALLAAVRHLSVVQPPRQPKRRIDFAHLGAEELGSIYESLLELVPRLDPVTHELSLEVLAGNDRKTTGSYYTPHDLVDLVLDTALDPVLDDAEKSGRTTEEVEAALLALRVCDPAVGSAHFLVGAARRIAARVAIARTGEVDPTPSSLSHALHDVVARCLYGVDVNPMAADLAKVSLWLTAMTPGRPLSFLDHHIKVGNALLGTTPALLAVGIPDAAYVALTGDDKPTAAAWRKANKNERDHRPQGDLFDDAGMHLDTTASRTATREVTERSQSAHDVAGIAWAEQRYADLQSDPKTVRARNVADAWCVAFLGHKTPDAVPITDRTLASFAAGAATEAEAAAVLEVARRHRLFHWHLEFPEVFTSSGPARNSDPYGWTGGFDAVLGNPPWERVKLQEQEFFASRDTRIAEALNAAARKKAIAALKDSGEDGDRRLFAEFVAARRHSEAESQFLRTSGRYPLCGVGDVNTYSVFAEHFRATLGWTGRSGIITPTGLATDATTAAFFSDTVTSRRLAAFYDFENEAKIFTDVTNKFHIAVASMSGGQEIREVRLAFYTRHVRDTQSRRFVLTADEVLLLNPNTGTLPVFRTRRDAEITLTCYRRYPVLVHDAGANPWGLRFSRLFDMANDSGLFRTADQLKQKAESIFDGWAWAGKATSRWPLYEAKMLSHWNSRYSTYDGATQAQLNKGTLPRLTQDKLDNPDADVQARYWVEDAAVRRAIPESWDRQWLFGWRDVTYSVNERTFVASVLPLSAVGHVFPLAFTKPADAPPLQVVWSSLVFDYIARQKLSGSHMTYGVLKQLACPRPEDFDVTPSWSNKPLSAFCRSRVLELAYTSHRLAPYAVDVIEGTPGETEPGPPFRWLPERRAQLTAELDAAMLHLYGLGRDDAEHVLNSFFVLRRYEERDHGEFRTARLVLAAYDAMTRAAETGTPFESPLDPPPGCGPRHPERKS